MAVPGGDARARRRDGGPYFVDQALWSLLEDFIKLVVLVLTVNNQGTRFLWPARLPKADGRADSWAESGLAAVAEAEHRWIRVRAGDGAYTVSAPLDEHPEPVWAQVPFEALLELAFKNRVISGCDHPIVKRLLGRAK